MKLNWGHYIFIAFASFVLLMLFMVYLSFQSDHDMVVEDYYAKELQYEKVINKKGRANKLEQEITWSSVKDGIRVVYPEEYPEIKGSIYLFRPSDKDLDLELIITPDTLFKQLIPMADLHKGKYIMQIDWSRNGVEYFTEGVVFVSK